MNSPAQLDADRLIAIDVHVHLEHTGELTVADREAQRYFGANQAARDWNTLADYYRSRRIACIVFTVDEQLSGRPQVSNDAVLRFAADHADIALAFVSIDPHRGKAAVAEA